LLTSPACRPAYARAHASNILCSRLIQ